MHVAWCGLSCGMSKRSPKCGRRSVNLREDAWKGRVVLSFAVQKGPIVRLIRMYCERMVVRWRAENLVVGKKGAS